MKPYRLTYEARQDFFDAFDFIASNTFRGALKWEAKMLDAFDHLAEWPKSGRLRPEFGPERIRFWIAEEYLVLYDSLSEPLHIIGIVHGAQDLVPLLMRRVEAYESGFQSDGNED